MSILFHVFVLSIVLFILLAYVIVLANEVQHIYIWYFNSIHSPFPLLLSSRHTQPPVPLFGVSSIF